MSFSIEFLSKHSNLPGARTNLGLLFEFIEGANEDEVEQCLAYADAFQPNTPSEFILMCGVAAWIKNGAIKKELSNFDISIYSNHESWRVRESICIGFQRSKAFLSPEDMMQYLSALKKGTDLDKRTYIATLCEPILLVNYISPSIVLDDLFEITVECFNHNEKLSDDKKVLRKALGYCWSVAICADEANGQRIFEKLIPLSESKHITWIVKENLSKNRMKKLASKNPSRSFGF